MKKKNVFILGSILLFLVIVTGLMLFWVCFKFPTNMAKVGYYAPTSHDNRNSIQKEVSGLMVGYENRGIPLDCAGIIPQDMESFGEYTVIQYQGNKILFKNLATKETSLIGELNGDEITVTDDAGNQAIYVWKGIPKEFGPFECEKDETKATKEIRANEEKRNKAFVGVAVVDLLVIGLMAGAFVWRRKRGSATE